MTFKELYLSGQIPFEEIDRYISRWNNSDDPRTLAKYLGLNAQEEDVWIEESDEVDGLLMILTTMGGDVEAGLAIAEMIASMKKPTVSLVLGGGHSIGVPLATAAKRSFIVPSATMTIHPVRVNGVVLGAPQTFHYFEEMQKRIVKFICEHSSSTPDIIRELMMRPDELATDIGSIIEGREAVEYGIIDEVGGLSDALAALKAMGELE